MSPITLSRFTFRTLLIYTAIVVCSVAFIVYVLFQARFLIAGPEISVVQMDTIQQERQIELRGIARNIVSMSLNGRQIYTDSDGNFNEALVLENGYTIATLQAHDRYGRTTSHTQTFVYTQHAEETQELVIQ